MAGDFDEVEASVGGHDPLVDRPAGRVQDVPTALFYPRRACPARWELGGGVAVLADHDPAAFFALAASGGDHRAAGLVLNPGDVRSAEGTVGDERRDPRSSIGEVDHQVDESSGLASSTAGWDVLDAEHDSVTAHRGPH